jgi:hypothetical protein
MARANIALAEEAADLRSQISVIRAVDMKPVAEAYAAAKAKTDALVGEHDVGSALRSLQERARASDAKSEEVHEKWLDGEIKGVDAFVEEFRRLREKHHEDAVKASIVEPVLSGAGAGVPGEAEVRVRRRASVCRYIANLISRRGASRRDSRDDEHAASAPSRDAQRLVAEGVPKHTARSR